jgi:hypothetical protein
MLREAYVKPLFHSFNQGVYGKATDFSLPINMGEK